MLMLQHNPFIIKSNAKTIRESKWSSLKKQRSFLDTIAKKFGIKSYEHWYNVSSQTIIDSEASYLLRKYNNSVPNMLSAIYPEYLLND